MCPIIIKILLRGTTTRTGNTMKQFLKSALLAGMTLGLLASTSITASAGSSFAYSGGKKAYDQKIANAAASLAAKKIGKLRGTISNTDTDVFITKEVLADWKNS